jgi:two-component system chemotaxis response regulator CheB
MASTSHTIKLLQVDDSAVVRQTMAKVFEKAADIELIGSAMDPLFAMEKMKKQWPDVILLDVEMPRMDGLTFLRQIMQERPTPVVICSTLTGQGTETHMEALASGAVDIVCKPEVGVSGFLSDSAEELLQTIRAAARANMQRVKTRQPARRAEPKLTADAVIPASAPKTLGQTTDKVIAIGSSTGGTQALEQIFCNLPRTVPGIVVVQHMPENFTRSFAGRLNEISELRVKEAESGDRVVPGLALIAPGGKHLLLRRNGAQYAVEVKDGPLVSRHRPSVDVLFRSVAKTAGKNALGIILTGMGSDGAHGMKEMRDAGAETVGQDEASCVVYGMPKEAMALGGVQRQVSLDNMAGEIIRRFRKG